MKNNSQLQKSAAKVALVIIDMMNDLEFDGEELYENALPAARRIAALKKKAHKESSAGDLCQRQLRSLAQRLQASR